MADTERHKTTPYSSRNPAWGPANMDEQDVLPKAFPTFRVVYFSSVFWCFQIQVLDVLRSFSPASLKLRASCSAERQNTYLVKYGDLLQRVRVLVLTALGSQGTIRDRWGSGTRKPQRKYNYSNNWTSSYGDTPQMQILNLIIVLQSLSH
jgi:hypothetical protein